MPSHNLITDPHIHEPKGISTAPEGGVYVSDGNGSGEWLQWPLGKAFYQHDGTGQVITTTPSKIIINGAGPLTRTDKLPREIRGTGELWDTVNNRVTPVRLNDGYLVRLDIPITAESGSVAEVKVQVEIGTGLTPSLIAYESYFPTGRAAPYTVSFTTAFDVLTNDTLTNGVEFFLSANAGTVTLGAPGIYITKVTDGDL